MELETFTAKVVPLREKLFRISLAIVREEAEAEDIVQEAFLKLWHIRGRLEGYRSVEALAVMTARNLAIDRLRQLQYMGDGELPPPADTDGGSPEELLVRMDAVRCVERLIGRLPTLQQSIIRMKDIEGYELEEIAAITGCRTDAVRVNLSRARKKIKEWFVALNKDAYEYR
ncbi:MAG: RNA polymerase sigma factor [Tannerellaceae bacterium]|jgi:RNA polymerase sigma-70 factor (ECF subfamily)|nr:RNA polymerase sigma factor [Tannerellaceae bacterium]